MKKRLMFLMAILALFFITVPLASSSSIDISVTPIKDLILPNEQATFTVTIANNQENPDNFRFSTNDMGWMIESSPGVLKVPAKNSAKAELRVKAIGAKQTSAYSINLQVFSQETRISGNQELVVRAVDYKDILMTKIEVPPTGLDIKKTSYITLKLINRYNIPLEDLDISLESEIFTIATNTDLNSIQTKEIKLKVNLDENTNEGLYDTLLLIKKGEKTLIDKIEKISVGPYSNVQQTKRKESKFLLSKTIITKTNLGNSNVYEAYSISVGSLEKKFTNFEPKPTSKKDDIYEWTFSLKPGEIYTITSTTNYRTPVIILIILLIIIWFIQGLMKNPVSIKKKVLTVRSKEGISDMKVLLIIKNNKKYETKDIKVVDTLPRIVKEPTEFGTVKPKILKKGEDKKLLLWDIPSLIKGEERILSYRIKSRIKVIGRLIIPKAVCSYTSRKSRKRIIVNSNKTVLFS
ncbi:MAG: hypothetical protein KKG60_02590 [Nanoarchaeota archaeon]|nr:hypothetical protein [Nanoarchaeota archaeon]